MKYVKYLLAINIVFLGCSFSYASTDISSLIFETPSITPNYKKTENKVSTSSDILFNNNLKSNSTITKKTKEEKEIDLFVEQALQKAMLKEEQLQKEKNALKPSNVPYLFDSAKKTENTQEVQNSFYKINFSDKTQMVDYAKSLLNTPYVYGGTGEKGFDCSGYVKNIYDKFDIKIPRTTYDQIKKGYSVKIEDLKPNDLIFFDTRAVSHLRKQQPKDGSTEKLEDIIIKEYEKSPVDTKLYPSEPTHVGMYIGDGKFIHASSSKKQTVIEDVNNEYFKNRIVDAKRYI